MRAVDGVGGRTIGGWERPASLTVEGGIIDGALIADARDELQRSMTAGAGVLRDAESLKHTLRVVERASAVADSSSGTAAWELANLVAVASALLCGALARTESRGAHTREDFPDTDPDLALRLVVG
jgi:succinate dehydrogenase/fumarate reductase flavoprotein subunit